MEDPTEVNNHDIVKPALRPKKKEESKMASIPETMGFVFECGTGTVTIFVVGCLAAFLNGLVGPMLAVLFSIALSHASTLGVDIEDIAFDDIQQVCRGLVLVGLWAFGMTFVQTLCLEVAAFRAARSLNLQWFHALLRQDSAYFDVYNVPGVAAGIQPTCYRYRRGMGSKFGEGIQYATTVVGGVGFAFVASWKISVLVLVILPFCALCSVWAVQLNQNRTAAANRSYQKAGTVALATVSSLRTILAFNAIPRMIQEYKAATAEAARVSKRFMVKYGMVNGFFLSSYIVMFVAVSLYGAFLLYTDIEEYGCDPTAGIFSEEACATTGASVLGAFLGFLFAAEGMSQVANFLEAFVEARVAAADGLKAIHRTVGAPTEIIYNTEEDMQQLNKVPGMSDTESESDEDEDMRQRRGGRRRIVTFEGECDEGPLHKRNMGPIHKRHQRQLSDSSSQIFFEATLGSNIDLGKLAKDAGKMIVDGGKRISSACSKKNEEEEEEDMDEEVMNMVLQGSMEDVKAILPKFEIDAHSTEGVMPGNIKGSITFHNVCFSYPTRPGDQALNNFNIDIEAGSTIAFVGPSGSGKSTIVSMIERFYDPSAGTITLDGINLKHFNVPHLRQLIGYVGQEPTLFNTTIQENIAYGCPGATLEQVHAAAKMANAHEFICEFPSGYATQVGDRGSQLSGGQKQRIAIARVLISNPKILLLDEATSALDSESELVVQDAIDNILEQKKITTIIIAHRLCTIRGADVIAVVAEGGVVETGTHKELMRDKNSYYRKLVKKQEGTPCKPPIDDRSNELFKLMVDGASKQSSPSEEDLAKAKEEADNARKSALARLVPECYTCLPTLDAPETVELLSSPSVADSICRSNNIEVVYYPELAKKQEAINSYRGTKNSLATSQVTKNELATNPADVPHINFKNVCFAYPTRPAKKIFADFNLSIRCGETVALVGPSGGGKSTTVAMIERFYDPCEGVLEYMGYDARWLNTHWYREQIGLVSQEPNLLNDTIANNIAFGESLATFDMIVEAAKQANAHDFISSFPDGYNTQVGNRGAQLSGGQKQRIAIARALLKKPKVLILDEATSALDSESEAIVQGALDKLMASREHTTIVIAHRLSTIRHADRIAYISDGKVQEIGSHDELLKQVDGRYRRLVESQKRSSTLSSVGLDEDDINKLGSPSSFDESEACTRSELEGLGTTYFNAKRVWKEAGRDICFVIAGSIGSIVNGAIFPIWGIMFAQTIDLFFHRVLPCSSDDEVPVEGFETCQDYWSDEAEAMRNKSFQVGLSWFMVVIACLLGAVTSKVGFGTAAERLNKRIRDNTFVSLVRQEVTFFDRHSVGRILSVLQDDTTKLYAFTGEPLRMFWIGMSSVAIGVALSFFFVWPVALLALGCIPLMGYALSLRIGKASGLDRGDSTESVQIDSPGGILVETLENIQTVAALTLEEFKFEEFKESLASSEPNNNWESTKTAFSHGMAYLIHHWVDALLLFFGGWLLHAHPTSFTFLDVLNSNLALYFSLFGLGIALKEVADREEIKQATSRVFYVLDRQSALDPLSKKGQTLS